MKKRIISLILCIATIMSMFVCFAPSAGAVAATTVSKTDVIARMQKITRVLNGRYFTESTNKAVKDNCSNVDPYYVLGTDWFIRDFGEKLQNYYPYGKNQAFTCLGFAKFVQWYMFSLNYGGISRKTITKSTITKSEDKSKFMYDKSLVGQVQLGDLLTLYKTNENGDYVSHYVVALKALNNGILVIDSNYGNGNKVAVRLLEYTIFTKVGINRCTSVGFDVSSITLREIFGNSDLKNIKVEGTKYTIDHYFEKSDCKHTTIINHPEKAATCTQTGNKAYKECTECCRIFDVDGVETTLAKVTISAKHNTVPIAASKATESKNGNIGYYYCNCCQGYFLDSAGSKKIDSDVATYSKHCKLTTAKYLRESAGVISGNKVLNSKLPEGTIFNIDYITANSNTDVWACGSVTVNGKTYTKKFICIKDSSKENNGWQIEYTVPTCDHNMVKTNAKASTATKAGNLTYYTCNRCGGIYLDAAGTEKTTAQGVIVPKRADISSKISYCNQILSDSNVPFCFELINEKCCRKGPGVSNSSLKSLPVGTYFVITKVDVVYGSTGYPQFWAYGTSVSENSAYNNIKGWVCLDDINGKQADFVKCDRYQVACSSLNCRPTASTSQTKRGSVPKNSIIVVLKYENVGSNVWGYGYCNSMVGYYCVREGSVDNAIRALSDSSNAVYYGNLEFEHINRILLNTNRFY